MKKFWYATFDSCVTYSEFAFIKQKIIDYSIGPKAEVLRP